LTKRSKNKSKAPNGLSAKQKRFVEEYVKDCNATKAAERARYSKKTANEQGARLLANVSIKKEIAKIQKTITKRNEIEADDILREVAALSFSNISDYVDVIDNTVLLKDWSKLTREQLAAVSEIQIQKERTVSRGAESKEESQVIRFKLYDKRPNLELLARRFNLFPNKVQLTDPNDKPIELVRVVYNMPEKDDVPDSKE
jgi:phage terminase small subunit